MTPGVGLDSSCREGNLLAVHVLTRGPRASEETCEPPALRGQDALSMIVIGEPQAIGGVQGVEHLGNLRLVMDLSVRP
ncbi:MAG: hypothetical protein AAGA17_20055 [Actinomycetota bacterium]